jgi:selenide,water dikinase
VLRPLQALFRAADFPDLLVGLEKADDAGVYQLSDELALVQTVDFFSPIVDDPYLFGQVAAANALSDVYAMGGQPLCAMNIVCFPSKTMDIGVLREVLRGGLDKLHEAGAALAGGHSVDDAELKYGLSVTGTVHPRRFWQKRGARAGDRLLLTKALGTGVIASAIKRGQASLESVEAAARSMTALNRRAMELLLEGEVHACTDVTGFGLLGHACEMLEPSSSSVGFRIASGAVPVLPGALEYLARGLKPGGLRRNREYRAAQVRFEPSVSEEVAELLFDPQTSGGLLAAVPEQRAQELLERCRSEGMAAALIGEVVAVPAGLIVVG